MRNYCAVFDKGYMIRGLVLHKTLMEHASEETMLYILALDQETVSTLKRLGLQRTEVIDLRDFEAKKPRVVRARGNRSWTEFCWTMGSVFCDALINDSQLTNITYLDSDMMVFSDPKTIHEELVGSSIGITPHRLIKARQELIVNGVYNVGWVTFKHSPNGYNCAREWSDACLDWCYGRYEDGKFGDQKYLDEWPKKYHCCCHVIKNLGCNMGPWSISQWRVEKREDGVYVESDKLVIYHFHEFKKMDDGTFYYTGWPLQYEAVEHIYKPYVKEYLDMEQKVRSL